MKLTKKIRVSPCENGKLPRNPPEPDMKSWDLILMPWRSPTETAPSDQHPEIGHTAMKITESCRCQTCEVKAVRVCTSTPKKNRSIVWMILLVLWCFLVQSPAGNSAFNNINLYELEWSGTWVRWEAYEYFKKNLDIRGYTRICLDILRSQTQIGITDL